MQLGQVLSKIWFMKPPHQVGLKVILAQPWDWFEKTKFKGLLQINFEARLWSILGAQDRVSRGTSFWRFCSAEDWFTVVGDQNYLQDLISWADFIYFNGRLFILSLVLELNLSNQNCCSSSRGQIYNYWRIESNFLRRPKI